MHLILKDASHLGMDKTDITRYFELSPRKEVCRDSSMAEIIVVSKMYLAYGSGRDYLFLKYQEGRDIGELILIVGKTPYLSLRARLERGGFEQVRSQGDWIAYGKEELVVDLYFREMAVMDIYSDVEECLGQEFDYSAYTVVVFSLQKT
mgnify:CR=1 FL=1